MQNQLNFGNYLKKKREEQNLTLNRLSELAGVSPSYLSRVERGERSVPHAGMLKKLAPHLGLTTREILTAAGYLDRDTVDESTSTKEQAKHNQELLKDPSVEEALYEVAPLDSEEKEGLLLYLKAIKLRREQKKDS